MWGWRGSGPQAAVPAGPGKGRGAKGFRKVLAFATHKSNLDLCGLCSPTSCFRMALCCSGSVTDHSVKCRGLPQRTPTSPSKIRSMI